MPYKPLNHQTPVHFNAAITPEPTPKHVAHWLYLADSTMNPENEAAHIYGLKMIYTYFNSKEAAETFIIHETFF
jgi:hypothetical protein